jgi:hypothetical protein
MQMTRINIPVTNEELEALQSFAQRDLRHPRDQARYLLRAAMGMNGDDVQSRPNANRVAVDSEALRDAVAV